MIVGVQNAEMDRAINSIRERFIVRLKEQLVEFDILMFEIEGQENIEQPFAIIKAGAHKIAGLAGAMGFEDLGIAALRVDELTLATARPSEATEDRQHLIDTIDRFLDCCDDAVSAVSDGPS